MYFLYKLIYLTHWIIRKAPSRKKGHLERCAHRATLTNVNPLRLEYDPSEQNSVVSDPQNIITCILQIIPKLYRKGLCQGTNGTQLSLLPLAKMYGVPPLCPAL